MLAQPKRTHLNRALSKLGLCSRGIADQWIAGGRVSVNGILAESPEQWVDLASDRIEVAEEGETFSSTTASSSTATSASASASTFAKAPTYIALHKPPGYVTTRSDELGRKTVYDLLTESFSQNWLFPVGRLDKESEGLLLMTNDGEWANLLTDPEYHVAKIYRVKVDGKLSEAELVRFREGIVLEGSVTLPAGIVAEGSDWYQVVLTEGRNRQIRKMFHALGYKVKRLVRVAIGDLQLGDQKAGALRVLDPQEVAAIKTAALKQAK